MIEAKFEHWKYEFSEEDLQYGSPNKSLSAAKSRLLLALRGAKKIQERTEKPIIFTKEQILCANEAFPEAALADPLADLRVWNEWRSGVRIFPYPGIYSRLSITNQPGKANSTSSVGVIGEIIAGLFGQAIIAPDILVRVIRQWPDFIFYPVDGRYAFLEAKAFTPQPKNWLDNKFKVPKTELGECLINAIHHLAIDPFVKIWYSFTEIQQIEPTYSFYTTFFELGVNDIRRDSWQKTVPIPVIDGLAERAIQKGISILGEELLFSQELTFINSFLKKNKSKKRLWAEDQLIYYAEQQIEEILSEINYNQQIYIERNKFEKSVKTQVRNLIIPEWAIDSKIFSQSKYGYEPELIREIGLNSLYKQELKHKERAEIFRQWKPDINQANIYWKNINNRKYWRCGSTAFGLSTTKETSLQSPLNI